jgi:hypothetical protein
VHKDVIVGGGLTNRPVAKGMMPINFSEVFVEVDSEQAKEFATPKKPYGNVTYADPGYQSDKKKRYPLDTETHIRAAWSYINMPKNAKKYTSSQLTSIKGKIRAAMKRVGAQLSMAEMTDEVIEADLDSNIFPEEVLAVVLKDECAPEEHHEPGTDAVDPSINEDDSYPNRVDTPAPGEDGSIPSRPVTDPNPLGEGGEVMTEEQLKELRTALGLEEDADADKVLVAAKAMSEELEPLRELRSNVESKKKFAEEYPEEAKRLAMLEESDQKNFAKTFSESFVSARVINKAGDGDEVKDEPTTLGFSGRVINEIQDVAKQFSEGKPTFEGFKGVLDAIIDNGIVDYGNKGSEVERENDDDEITPVAGSKDARTKFAEKVEKIMADDEVDFRTALETASKLHPKLAEAWRQPPVAA